MATNKARTNERNPFSGPTGWSAKPEMTRTDRLPIDRLVEKLRAERHQRALKDRCLSMISHKLRTPLASIQLSHYLLARYSEQATAEESQQYLDNICQQVARLNEIVSDVLNLSSSNRSGLDFNPARHDLLTLCRDIVESFQLNHHQRHHFAFHCAETRFSAEFDERLLRRALSDLVGNAVKYSPDGGRIELTLWREGEFACITVSDEGIGIPAEDTENLFMAFHRASNVRSFPGTGLGLAVTKQTLDLHGGDICVTSELGLGTTFKVVLPTQLACSHSPEAQLPQMQISAKIGA